MRGNRWSIRTRLTLWYAGTLTIVLLLYAVTAYLFVWHGFESGLESADQELDELALVLGLGLPIAVGTAAIGGYVLARRALRPVADMIAEAKTITAENLSARLSVDNPDDEIGRLAHIFNETLARLESSFDQLKRFTADASHELRTPLTAIRSVGEVALSEHRNDAEYRETISSMLEETDRLARLVDTLLTLARADARSVKPQRDKVDLRLLAREVVEHLAALSEEKHQTVVNRGDGSVVVMADRLVLRQAVINLLDNAIKYSPDGASIRVAVSAQDHTAVIEVVDSGPGIPAEHRDRIFDRFYRVDKARSRHLGGAGLGLSIARSAVELHGGSISLESSERGSTFRIQLPLAGDTND
jgi:heavy metal sensor kinase